jgi:cysteine desulfurase
VLDSCRALEAEGFKITYLPVGTNGIISLEDLDKVITPETSLVSIMTVNNEIGVKQPIAEIGALCKKKKVFFHTDAAQAVGKIPIDVNTMNIDLMSISGHKVYGPKGKTSTSWQQRVMHFLTGVGVLYLRRRPRVRVEPIQSGGGQERGIRSGTVPTHLAVGMGEACAICEREMAYDHAWMEKLSQRLMSQIFGSLTHVIRNGDPVHTYPGCINLSFAFVEGIQQESDFCLVTLLI